MNDTLASISHHVPASVKPVHHWETWEINLLLDCISANQLVSVNLPRRDRMLQSVLIGFDLNSSTLLLDTLFPCSEREIESLWRAQTPLVITIPSTVSGETFYYNITVLITHVQLEMEGFLTEVSVQGVDVSSRRRRDSRIHFDQSARPAVELASVDCPLIQGRLCNLSQYGCLVEFFGNDASRKLQNRQVSLDIHFNTHFDINVSGFVVQARFSKRPSYHNRLHIQFRDVNASVETQINQFITSVVRRESIAPHLVA